MLVTLTEKCISNREDVLHVPWELMATEQTETCCHLQGLLETSHLHYKPLSSQVYHGMTSPKATRYRLSSGYR